MSDFSSRIAKRVSISNKFEVSIHIFQAKVDATLQQLNLMCDQCSLAGRDVQAY